MSIVLRDAFHYCNFIDNLIGNAQFFLRDLNNVMVITKSHQRSKAWPGATDDVITNETTKTMNVDPNVMVDFLLVLLEEKEKIGKAITKAKNQHCVDMDNEISMNKTRKNVVDSLRRIVNIKNKEVQGTGKDFGINAEGNQVSYNYPVVETHEINFDRKKIKAVINKLTEDSNIISNRIDYWTTSIPVDYDPPFSENDTLEELIEQFVEMDTAS